MMQMPRKGYGKIYVEKAEDIEKVKDIIKEMDEYEFTHYLPEDLIAVFEDKINTTYTHKFDSLDLGVLMENCWKQGIKMFCVDGRYGRAIYD